MLGTSAKVFTWFRAASASRSRHRFPISQLRPVQPSDEHSREFPVRKISIVVTIDLCPRSTCVLRCVLVSRRMTPEQNLESKRHIQTQLFAKRPEYPVVEIVRTHWCPLLRWKHQCFRRSILRVFTPALYMAWRAAGGIAALRSPVLVASFSSLLRARSQSHLSRDGAVLRRCRNAGVSLPFAGCAGKDMSNLYDKIKEDVAFRRKWAKRCGFWVPVAFSCTECTEKTEVAIAA